MSAEIRDDYFAKIVKKNVGFFDVTKMGQIISRQTDDINLISDVLANSFNVIVKSLCYSILVIVILFWISPTLMGIFLAGLFVLSMVSGGLRRKTSMLNREYQEQKGKLAEISEEVFGNIRTVKAFHNESAEI